MANSKPQQSSGGKNPNLTASDLAAGGGAGGALIFAINTYVSDPKLQTLLVYLVPTVSIIALGIYTFALEQCRGKWTSYEAELARKKLLKRANVGLSDAKAQLTAIEADPGSTAEHKRHAREQVQKFESAVLELHAKGIVVIP